MDFQRRIAIIFGGIAVMLLVAGLPRINSPENYYRPEGKWERVKGQFSRTHEVTLNAGQTAALELFAYNSPALSCLAWEAEDGTSSVSLTARMRTRQGRVWQHVQPSPLCLRDSFVQATITSHTDQVVRLGMAYDVGGYRPNFCRECETTMSRRGDLPTVETVQAEGWKWLRLAAIPAIIGTVAAIGLQTVIAALYELARVLFPSRHAQRVRQEIQRVKQGGAFRPDATSGYSEPAANTFRRQQNTDDLDDLTAELRRENARLKEAEERERERLRREEKLDAEEERLTKQMEESLERIKELKARIDRGEE